MNDKEFTLFDLFKVAIFMAGLIYVVHLLSWLMHWGVLAAGMAGVGYLAYRIGSVSADEPKMLVDDDERRWLELEEEEKRLDREIGIT